MTLLSVEHIEKTYPGNDYKVLDNASFKVGEGELAALVGHSGSGKTTLLHLIAGIDDASKGKILFEGKDVLTFSKKKRKEYQTHELGIVFQTFHLLPYLTVKENIALPQVFDKKLSPAVKEKRVDELVKKVGLESVADKKASEISGGQKQRVAIARALVNKPKLILADEPTGNLDIHTGTQIMELLKSLVADEKRTILLVTHETHYLQHVDHVFEMEEGKVREKK